ncbi:MAG: AbrB/MazE/SpoVT family DNA-binding domain-containing protein [Acidimicrobiales bacterium]
MRTTIDSAGRLVIPKALRNQVGVPSGPSEVDIVVDGAGLRIEPVAGEGMEERDGRLVIPPSGLALDDNVVSELRHADQR